MYLAKLANKYKEFSPFFLNKNNLYCLDQTLVFRNIFFSVVNFAFITSRVRVRVPNLRVRVRVRVQQKIFLQVRVQQKIFLQVRVRVRVLDARIRVGVRVLKKKFRSPSASPQVIKFAFFKKKLNVKSTIRDFNSL